MKVGWTPPESTQRNFNHKASAGDRLQVLSSRHNGIQTPILQLPVGALNYKISLYCGNINKELICVTS